MIISAEQAFKNRAKLRNKMEDELSMVIASYTKHDAKKMIEEHTVVMAGGTYSDEDAEA